VRIGYENNNKEIPLSRLCYALLHCQEESLFPLDPEDIYFKEELDFDDRDEYYGLTTGPKCI
jgi:hypothetical protein